MYLSQENQRSLPAKNSKIKAMSIKKNGKLSIYGAPVYSSINWEKKKFTNPKATVNVATLFSGIGAVEQALKRLKVKHNIIFAGDIDKHVKKSYFANYKISEEDWHSDITEFLKDAKSVKKYRNKVDLLVGGSPCQSFSMVGKRGGFEDTRGTLFHDFIRVINSVQPKVFIYENVLGLLNHDEGQTWEIVQEQFELLEYNFFPMILNAKDYGVPQNRERIFVVGFKNKKHAIEIPKPIDLQKTMQDLLEDYKNPDTPVDPKYYLGEKGVSFVTNEKNLKKRYTQINGTIALCQKRNQQQNWHGDFVFNEVPEKYYLSNKVKKYVLSPGTKKFNTPPQTDLPVARTLLQSMHKMHRAGVDNYVTHNAGRIRKLTPRECLRLMGFDDDFKIEVSDTQMYRQTGNSIVVDVLMAILRQMDITLYGR
jgi:DNA (cytosine-5)-methyltransferase 1